MVQQIKLTRSYFGTIVVKQLPEVKEHLCGSYLPRETSFVRTKWAEESLSVWNWLDESELKLLDHCIIEKVDGEKILTVMTKERSDKSWSKSWTTRQFKTNFRKRWQSARSSISCSKIFQHRLTTTYLLMQLTARQRTSMRKSSSKDVTPTETTRIAWELLERYTSR